MRRIYFVIRTVWGIDVDGDADENLIDQWLLASENSWRFHTHNFNILWVPTWYHSLLFKLWIQVATLMIPICTNFLFSFPYEEKWLYNNLMQSPMGMNLNKCSCGGENRFEGNPTAVGFQSHVTRFDGVSSVTERIHSFGSDSSIPERPCWIQSRDSDWLVFAVNMDSTVWKRLLSFSDSLAILGS